MSTHACMYACNIAARTYSYPRSLIWASAFRTSDVCLKGFCFFTVDSVLAMQTLIPLRKRFSVRCTLLQKIPYQYNQERIRPAYAEVQSDLGFLWSCMIQATSSGRRLLQHIQSTLVISTSIISNNRLSRRENLVLVLTQKSKIRLKNIVEKMGSNFSPFPKYVQYVFHL